MLHDLHTALTATSALLIGALTTGLLAWVGFLQAPPTTGVEAWTVLIGAIVTGLISLITAIIAGIVLIMNNAHKADTDAKLEVIRVDVNSNLHKMTERLATATEQLGAALALLNKAAGDHAVTIVAEDLIGKAAELEAPT